MPQSITAAGCLFDMDGLLLDTEPLYTEATQSIIGRYGHTYDWHLKSNMIGRPALDSARYLVQALQLPMTAEDYLQQRNALLVRMFEQCGPMPGAQRLVRHLHHHGVPMALATSSDSVLYQAKTRRHQDWFCLFDTIIKGDDAALKHGKPAPDIFLLAAERIGVPAARALVFEDAPSGLAAGIAAQMSVIAVPDPNMDRQRYHGAAEILSSLAQFRPEAYGLPAF